MAPPILPAEAAVGVPNDEFNLSKFKPMHEISYLSAYVGEYFLKNKGIIDKYIRNVKDGTRYFENFLKQKNINFFGSEANFILVDFKNKKNFKK